MSSYRTARDADLLVVVPCSRAKRDAACPAGELYLGELHKAARRAAAAIEARAEAIGVDARTVVLSGAHGLLDLATVLAPYEQRIDAKGAVTGDELVRQAGVMRLLDRPVVALTPRAYTDALRFVWGDDVIAPLDGSRGIGYHRQRLARIVADPSEVLVRASVVAARLTADLGR